jgi:hypothetical protein
MYALFALFSYTEIVCYIYIYGYLYYPAQSRLDEALPKIFIDHNTRRPKPDKD